MYIPVVNGKNFSRADVHALMTCNKMKTALKAVYKLKSLGMKVRLCGGNVAKLYGAWQIVYIFYVFFSDIHVIKYIVCSRYSQFLDIIN